MTTATSIYRAFMLEIERRRVALGWPMDKFSEFAGVPDRYYAKALNADSSSGRQAQWRTLQLIVDALFQDGFDVCIKPLPGSIMTKESLKAKLLQLQATKDPRSQRELMAELGRKGGAKGGRARAKKLGKRGLSQANRKAAVIRWDKVKAAVKCAMHERVHAPMHERVYADQQTERRPKHASTIPTR